MKCVWSHLKIFAEMYESEEVLSHFKAFHRENFDTKMSLMCLTKYVQGLKTVAGLNAMHVKHLDDEDELKDEERGSIVLNMIKHLYDRKDPFKELNIDRYGNAVGLYVFPEFRGEGIGQEILNARRLLCQDLGITTSLTFFMSYISQGMAEKSGFQDFCMIDYDKFPDYLIVPKLHNEHTKSARLIYIKY